MDCFVLVRLPAAYCLFLRTTVIVLACSASRGVEHTLLCCEFSDKNNSMHPRMAQEDWTAGYDWVIEHLRHVQVTPNDALGLRKLFCIA